MAALGTLVTIVTADISGFEARMTEAAETAKEWEIKVTQSVGKVRGDFSGWGDELTGVARKFTSLAGLLKAGFGLSLGNFAFGAIHGGLSRAISGFNEGIEKSNSFGLAIENSLSRLVGLKSQVDINADRTKAYNDELAASKKRLDDVAESSRRAQKALGDFLAGAGPKTASFTGTGNRFPDLSGAESHLAGKENERASAERALAQMPETERAKFLEAEVARLRAREQSLEKGSYSAGEFREFRAVQAQLKAAEKELGQVNALLAPHRDNLKKMDDAIKSLSEQYAKDNELESALNQSKKLLEERQKERARLEEEAGRNEAEIMRERMERAKELERSEEMNRQDRLNELIKKKQQDAQSGRLDISSGQSFRDQLQQSMGGNKVANVEQQIKQTEALERIDKNIDAAAKRGNAFEPGGIVA